MADVGDAQVANGDTRARTRKRAMAPLLILGGLCVVLALVALWIGGTGKLTAGINEGVTLLVQFAPQMAIGFLLAGLVSVLVPASAIGRLVGAESGLSGLLIATVAGALTPGGPFLHFPLVAVLLRGGAGEGPVAAYLTAWALLGLNRMLVWEIPVLGPTFALSRWGVSLVVPVLVGVGVQLLLRALRPT
jgi:uncharacterized membrane protein YraQ (UPF0718 family)